MPVRNEAGIAMPMNSEARPPSTNRMMTKTSSTAVITVFCRSCSIWRMVFDLSCVKATSTVAGPGLLAAASTTAFTPSTVSIRLAPVRFETSMAMAGRPLTRVIEVASLKVGRTVGDVAERHRRAERVAATGILSTSSGCLDQRRHLDGEAARLRPRARRPRPGCCRLRDARRAVRATGRSFSGASARR